MSSCERIRPLLYRIVEHEADPAEAIEAARHLPRCTACKILLARERRLATLLEQELADLAVDDSFVRDVMDTLPAHPPRPAAQIRVLRGMKLACLVGLMLLCGSGSRHAFLSTDPGWFASPTVSVGPSGDTGAMMVGAATLAVRALAAAGPVLSSLPRAGAVVLGAGWTAAVALTIALAVGALLGVGFVVRLLDPTTARASRAGSPG